MEDLKFKWFFNIFSFFLISLIIIFSIISLNLRPLAKWATYQNQCIKDESVNKTIPWAVRKCNGRSKVYQVK